MGLCFSSQVKAQSPNFSGSIPKNETTEVTQTDVITCSRVSLTHLELPTFSTEADILSTSHFRRFTFADLMVATKKFRPENVLGEGGLGYVFKGCVDDQTLPAASSGTNMVIAVKRLEHIDCLYQTKWLEKIHFLGQLHHPNLVKLIGYCIEDDERLLVIEFVARGSLENHLFRRGSYFQPLSWNLRLKVALGAAKGLAFLHGRDASVVYSNLKTSSILLDLNYNAKLSFTDLAKAQPADVEGHSCTTIVKPETHVFAAPEYIMAGHLTAKSDVYSFGVVLLEMISGRRAVDSNTPRNEKNLVEWAKPYLADKRKVIRVVDNRLEGQYTIEAALSTATLSLRCLSTEAKLRPTMEQVVNLLEKLYDPNETLLAQTKISRGRSAEVPSQAKSANTAKKVHRRKNSVA